MTQDLQPDNSSTMDLPFISHQSLPVHEILRRLAEVIPPDITNELPGVTLADIKGALEFAEAAVSPQDAQLTTGSLSKPDNEVPVDEISELNLRKILVVDDHVENRNLVEIMLTRNGFIPVMAANGKEGLEKARTERPVLILSDIMMPNMTGLDMLKELKADERTKEIAVILMTAHLRDSKQISIGLNLGANDYIQRPFSTDEFISRINAVIRVKQAEAEKQRQAQLVQERNKGLNLVYKLALAVNSSPDTRNVFISSVQNLSNLLKSDAVSLLLFDEEKQQLTVNISARNQQYISEVVHLDKFLPDEVPALVSQVINQHNNALGITLHPDTKTIEYLPVHSRERQIVGAVAIVNQRAQSLSDTDQILLHSAVNIIAIALENAHLLENAQQQIDDLIALNEIGRSLSSTLELDQTFAFTTQHIQNLIHSEITSLWILDDEDETLKLMTASNGNSSVKADTHFGLYHEIASKVADTGEAYLVADISKDKAYQQFLPDSAVENPSSVLCVPAKFEDKIIGVILSTHSKPNRFNQNHLRLSYPVANSVGIALKNTQLFSKVQEFNNFLEQMVIIRTQQLAEEKEKIETILANMDDGLLVLDANNNILTSNAAAEDMLNFNLTQLLGTPIAPGQMEAPLWRSINEIAHDSQPAVTVTVDVPLPQSGKKRSIEAHSAKVQGETGQLIGTVIVLRDITALKEVEQMKSRFMAGVTHELKTPLAIIQLHTNNLSNYYDRLSDEKKRDLLQAVQNQVKILKQLIENILHLSRYDSGMIQPRHQPVEVTRLIEQVVTDLRPLADEKHITLNWQKPAKEIKIMSNANQLERVIRNLIDNAIKYTPPAKSIAVEIESEKMQDRPYAIIKVADTGIGIAPEHQKNIFERFYRVDPSHTIPGSGLGLSIVKEIVNLHQGTVELQSNPGAGSIFTVILPSIV